LEVDSTSRTQQLKCRVVSISATKNTDLLPRSKSSEQTGCSVLATATDMRAGKNQVCRTKQPMCKQLFYSAHCCIKAEIKYIVLSEGTRALKCLLCRLHGAHIKKNHIRAASNLHTFYFRTRFGRISYMQFRLLLGQKQLRLILQ